LVQVLAWTPGTLKRASALVFEGTRLESALRITTALVVLVGLWLRTRGFFFSPLSLWLDEASWAIRLMERPLVDDLIRPIGFMAVTRALARVFGPSEVVLRFLPWCAGFATTLMAPALGKRLFRSGAARLLFVCVLSLHPAAIDLSKEFKPYAIGLALHVALVLLALTYCESGKRRDLIAVLALACVAVLFAQDALFAYPGLFLVLAISAFKARRLRHLGAVALSAAVALAVVVGLYVFVWSQLDHTKEEAYWGKKYDVFYEADKSKDDKLDWIARHYAAVAAAPGSRRSLWTSARYPEKKLAELRSFDGIVWILLHMAGLTFIVRTRKFREALLLVLPLDVAVAFNALGFWPLGDFRTNLFVLVYAAAIAAFGVERHARRVIWADFIPAGFLVLAPLFAFERTWHARKTMDTMTTDYPGAMRMLIHLQKPGFSGRPERLVLDQWTCEPWRYYTTYHPTYSHELAAELARRFTASCQKGNARNILGAVRSALFGSPRVWIVASNAPTMRALDRSWPHDLQRVALARVGADEHLVLGVTAKVDAPPAPVNEPEPDSEEQ
jgi:4-amino-4-deoxy-L-arabinose transferase-like glycosyltransferase